MFIGKVMGPVVASQKHKALKDRKLLSIKPVHHDGKKKTGPEIVAIDPGLCAGPGDLVLVNKEGKAAATLLDYPKVPVNMVITAIIDEITLS